MDNYHISICGNVGVGKSTLAKVISRIMECRLFLEEPEKYPFIEDAFNDPHRWSFTNQCQFLLSKISEQIEMNNYGGVILQEMDASASHNIWTPVLKELHFIDNREMDLLNLSYKILIDSEISRPSSYLFLKCDPETIIERLAARDRKFEIDSPRIKELVNYTNYYFLEFIKCVNVPYVIIDSGQVNFINDIKSVSEIVLKIMAIQNSNRTIMPSK